MSFFRFDTYYRYADLVANLNAFAEKNPHLVSVQVIGKSFEGRDIIVATITNFDSASPEKKPAFWVDGNLHAAELVGSMACLYLIEHLVSHYGKDSDVTRCLDTRVFYICPRANPDGAEWALGDVPKLIRSSTRPYPVVDSIAEGITPSDIDRDGRILTMRIRDPNGNWKKSNRDPRLLVPREPVEYGGEYYRLLPEGNIENYDGVSIKVPPKREGLDLNRNFPAQWRLEHEQRGAGPYPVSEPEVRAEVDFISRHPNICGGITFHSYSGALLRPFSYKADDQLPAEDLWTYQTIGEKGTSLTGYPAVSVYHDFRYHPEEIITGALDDWLYEHQGVFGWTVEIWSPLREAGIKDFKLFDWYRSHPQDDDFRLLKWSDHALKGKGYIDWYPFIHPQLGEVELGGWDSLFSYWNPPPHLLEKEISLFPRWVTWHCMLSPKLEWHSTHVTDLGNDHYRVVVAVHNTGWLPTTVTKLAQKRNMLRGVQIKIEIPNGCEIVAGLPRQNIGQLDGRNYKNCSINSWAGQTHDPTNDRGKCEWIIKGRRGESIQLIAEHERAGSVETKVQLG